MPELVDILDPTEDDRLLQAEALVRSFCGWHISPSRTETVTTSSQFGSVFLRSLHVTDVSAVSTIDGDELAADYTWTESGVLSCANWYKWTTPLVTVTFTHGFNDINDVADVTAVVQAVAQRAVDGSGRLTSSTRGPFSESYAQATGSPISLLEAEKATLRSYRVPRIG